MKRVLMLASVASMIDQFNMPNIALLQKLGYEVDVACNFIEGNTCSDERVAELKQKLQDMHVHCYQIDFARNIKHMGQNMKALWQVEALMKQNTYEFCHCHSPIGGVVARIAGHRTRTKVIYTAHGFHFYQGAPIVNWLVYYPVEKVLSRWTEVLITINHEDYALAKKKFHAKKTYYLPGIGIDLEKFHVGNAEDIEKRDRSWDYIRKISFCFRLGKSATGKSCGCYRSYEASGTELPTTEIFYLRAGRKKQELQQLIRKYHLEDHVKLLGFRTDVAELCQAADVFVFPSKQEGLPVALMEAMACGVPVVCSRIRGNTDLVKNGENGHLVSADQPEEYIQAIEKLLRIWKNTEEVRQMRKNNRAQIKQYSLQKIDKIMENIYR